MALKSNTVARAGLVIILFASIVTLLWALSSANTTSTGHSQKATGVAAAKQPSKKAAKSNVDRSPEGNQTAKEIAYIERQENLVRAKLRDPKSAEFRNARVCYSMGPIVCGEVNSNNGFGGKTGYQRFVSGGEIQVLEEEMETGGMDKVWTKVCP